MKAIVGICLLVFTQISCATPATIGMPCADSNIQARRSLELQRILEADQADRDRQLELQKTGKQPTQKILEKMSRNDLGRRMRVGEIFGEGCLKTAADYKAAFFVYQHHIFRKALHNLFVTEIFKMLISHAHVV